MSKEETAPKLYMLPRKLADFAEQALLMQLDIDPPTTGDDESWTPYDELYIKFSRQFNAADELGSTVLPFVLTDTERTLLVEALPQTYNDADTMQNRTIIEMLPDGDEELSGLNDVTENEAHVLALDLQDMVQKAGKLALLLTADR